MLIVCYAVSIKILQRLLRGSLVLVLVSVIKTPKKLVTEKEMRSSFRIPFVVADACVHAIPSCYAPFPPREQLLTAVVGWCMSCAPMIVGVAVSNHNHDRRNDTKKTYLRSMRCPSRLLVLFGWCWPAGSIPVIGRSRCWRLRWA